MRMNTGGSTRMSFQIIVKIMLKSIGDFRMGSERFGRLAGVFFHFFSSYANRHVRGLDTHHALPFFYSRFSSVLLSTRSPASTSTPS